MVRSTRIEGRNPSIWLICARKYRIEMPCIFLFQLTIAPLNDEYQDSHKCCEHDRRGQD